MRVFLNLLAATDGGQLSRARAFLDRFNEFAPTAHLVIAKEQSVLTEYTATAKRVLIDVPIGRGRFKALRRMWWENTALQGVIRRSQADVYLTFSHYLPHLNSVDVPSVVGVSNLAPFSAEAWNEEPLLIRLKLAALQRTILSSARRAHRVIALSDHCRDVLIRNGISREKIVVVPNGVDTHWSELSQSTGVVPRFGVVRPYLLYVSHIHRYKNFIRLVEAYARMPSKLRAAHQLVLVGKPYDESYFQEIVSLIEHLELVSEVILIPGLSGDDLKEFYQQAKLFVFPSLIENSPNILLEAMAAGLPVASSNLAPMPEYCGNAADYFDALDVTEMSRHLELLLSDPDRLVELKDESRAQARKFSWDYFVADVVRHLRAVLGRQ